MADDRVRRSYGGAMSHGETSTNDPIVRFVGIYDADGTVIGELKYMAGKLMGTAHCALCDLTHGTKLKGRADFKACAESLPVPIDLFHRNDQPDQYRFLTNGELPCILEVRKSGAVELAVNNQQLADCQKDVGLLEKLLQGALDR